MTGQYEAFGCVSEASVLHELNVIDFASALGRKAAQRPAAAENIHDSIRSIKDGSAVIEGQMLELKRLSQALAEQMRQI